MKPSLNDLAPFCESLAEEHLLFEQSPTGLERDKVSFEEWASFVNTLANRRIKIMKM